MIQIKSQDSIKVQVLNDDLLLASFSNMEAAVEYAKATEATLRKNSSNETPAVIRSN